MVLKGKKDEHGGEGAIEDEFEGNHPNKAEWHCSTAAIFRSAPGLRETCRWSKRMDSIRSTWLRLILVNEFGLLHQTSTGCQYHVV